MGYKKWICSAIYASLVPATREILWDHLRRLRSSFNDPWLFFGDFNEILLPSEVSGGLFSVFRVEKFSKVMDDCGLLDMGAKGYQFTWYRKAVGTMPISRGLCEELSETPL